MSKDKNEKIVKYTLDTFDSNPLVSLLGTFAERKNQKDIGSKRSSASYY